MSFGSGGFYVAAQEMNRLRKEMDRYLADRDKRRVERDARRRARVGGAPLERVPGAFVLCLHCRYLGTAARMPCPACGHVAWVDLGNPAAADALRAWEERDRRAVPARVRVGLMLACLVGFGVAFIVWRSAFIILAAALSIPLAYWLASRPLAVLLLRLAAKRPHRWRLPVPLPSFRRAPERVISGTAQLAGEPLRAPFSGRSCIAYQACILFDAPDDARPPEWVLLESAAGDARVASDVLAGGRTVVQGPLDPVSLESAQSAGFSIDVFLEQRGLGVSDGDFWLFETRVENGMQVEARIFAEPRLAVLWCKPGQ